MTEIPPEINNQIKNLLVKKRKIEAVKLAREHMHWGLKEAKEYVDALAASLNTSGEIYAQVPHKGSNRNLLLIEGKLQALLRENRKIEAVRLVREYTGWGLKESKDYVDQLV
ncbi:MAG: ribosomal protein L7/L12 [Candidatus Thorarchaeota archaeon]